METFLNSLLAIFTQVGNLLFVPLIIIILGLVVRLGFKASLRSGLLTAVALAGVGVILTLFLNTLQPVAEAIANKMGAGLKLTYIDVGWPACFAAGVALPIGVSYVAIGVLVNLGLVLLRWVKTIQISVVEPIMGEGLIGYVAYAISGNYFVGLGVALSIKIITLILADWQQPAVNDFFKFEGVSLIQTGVNEFGLLGWPIAWLLGKVPFLKNRHFTADWVQEKLGVFGEPMFLGVIFGIGLGLLAGFNYIQIITLSIYLAAAMNILPRMIGILMEGLIPVMRGVGDWLQLHAKGRKVYIGMDPAIGTGHPAILTTVMIMIPITVLIAVFLPGNKVLPLGDLVTLVFTFMFLVVPNKGDILRSVITCIICVPILLWSTTLAAPYIHHALTAAGVIDGSVPTLCMFEGGQFYWYPVNKLIELISGHVLPILQ